jgi:tetratricopeptide (TPR) repeat protein
VISKEHLATVTEVLATASVVGVGLALGGPVGATVMAGIGINLGSNIIQSGSTHLKEKWISAKYGVLNHDIQRALARAFVKALISLEARYFELQEAKAQPPEKQEAIRGLFKELKDEAPTVFVASVESIVSGQEVKAYLYGEPETARARLWERVEGTKLLYTYYGDHFKEFLRERINDELVFWFGEELKTDNRECNKAWRAFQRMLLEGIQADVKAVQASQEMIRQDLQVLHEIRTQLDELKDTVDKRAAIEPFEHGLEQALNSIKAFLEFVARTTGRIETKADVLIATTARSESKLDTVVAALSPKLEAEALKVPDDVKALFIEGVALRTDGKYVEARSIFDKALTLATNHHHKVAIGEAKRYQALILKEFDEDIDSARALLEECLRDFREVDDQRHIAKALYQLGVLEIDLGNLDHADAHLSRALELDQANDEKLGIASTLQQLGRIRGERGQYDQAIDCEDQALRHYLSVYQEGEHQREKDLLLWIAGCYHNKGLAYERLGNVEEVEANYRRALEWHRKSGFKPDMVNLLYLLARLKFREGQYEEGAIFLDEATQLSSEIGNNHQLARCLDLRARVNYTIGQINEAIPLFESALAAIERTKDFAQQATYLDKLGQIYLKDKQQPERAREFFERTRQLSLREGLLEGYAEAVQNLAQVAHLEKNAEERDRLLLEGAQTLERLLLSTQSVPKRAFIIGQIGFCYERMESFHQALIYYQKAKKAFEDISDIGGLANCLGSIGRIKGLLGKKDEEFNAYRELKKVVDGTPYYDLIAGAAINLGEINMQMGNLDEAKMMFDEAEFLCRKYNLHYLPHLKKSLMRLTAEINIRKPPELSFKELLEELFELVDWFPEAKDNLLCLWIYGRDHDLYVNCRNKSGVKFMVCQDDLDEFLKIAEHLHPYHDLAVQVVSSEYEMGINIVPFPVDKKMFFGDRYQGTSDVATSKITGKGGVVLVGWTRSLPEQAHRMILSRSTSEILNQKIFFLPHERHLTNDKLLSDLRFCEDLGLIPIYEALPNSKSVVVIHSAKVSLPVFSEHQIEPQRKQIRKVKRALLELLSAGKDTARARLNDFVLEVDELNDESKGTQASHTEVYFLEFPSALEKRVHAAMVIEKK